MNQNSDQKDPKRPKADYSIEELEILFQFEKLLEFENLISTLATGLTNLLPKQVDQEIEGGLKLVAEFLGADRGGIFQFSEDQQAIRLTHCYLRKDIPPHPHEMFKTEDMPLWHKQALETMGVIVYENLPDDLPAEAEPEKQFCSKHKIKSCIAFPLWTGKDEPDGYIGFVFLRDKRTWLPQCIERIHYIGQIFANVLRHKRTEESLEKAYAEIKDLKELLEAENVYLKEEIKAESSYGDILGHSDAMKTVMHQVEQVAPTDSTVLIQGETGTGKELVARAIHKLSARSDKPMVRVNCAAIPPTLIESELFGHEKELLRAPLQGKSADLEIADGSTIFLDEIGELPADMQAKLLHVLELGQFERIGSTETIDIDIRVIAATNKNLATEVKEKRFREDLFYRLNIFPIEVPPLHFRKEDIPMLTWAFVQEFSVKMGKVIKTISPKTMDQLQHYPWPGNVRELRNVVERAMILTGSETLNVEMPRWADSLNSHSMVLEDVEKNHIIEVLSMTGWKVRGQDGAAELLHLKPSTLESKMQKLGIKRPG